MDFSFHSIFIVFFSLIPTTSQFLAFTSLRLNHHQSSVTHFALLIYSLKPPSPSSPPSTITTLLRYSTPVLRYTIFSGFISGYWFVCIYLYFLFICIKFFWMYALKELVSIRVIIGVK